MMYLSSTLHNGLDDILTPSFRTIHFDGSNAQNTVVTLLRRAWGAIPPDDIESVEDANDSLREFMQTESHSDWFAQGGHPMSAENPDKDSVETIWRKAILYHCMYFYDHFAESAANEYVR